MLTCNNLSAKRSGKILFKDLGFTLFPGSCLAMYGNNGSGKTTLLRIIAKLFQPLEGEILFNNINVNNALDEYYNLIEYFHDFSILNNELTVLENLKFWANLYYKSSNISAAIETFGLDKYIKTKVAHLSRGWKNRVALSKLLFSHASVWLLDEPFSALDPKAVSLLSNIIKARCSSSGIIIITSPNTFPTPLNTIELNLEDFQ